MYTLQELNLRDVSYILANLRKEDEAELMPLLPRGTPKAKMVDYVWPALIGPKYCVALGDQPLAAFGIAVSGQATHAIGWAFGCNRFKRTIPMIASFSMSVLSHWLVDNGFLRLEVRASKAHIQSNRWLQAMGFNRDCDLNYYGNNGEPYVLYSLTIEDYYRFFPNRKGVLQ